ncbi:hypothetical protein DESUT3_29740 [Desulfuromonas versatilis]|uniref:Coiled coil domain-containing protein n=1 Tax=Desulfuromonas versatilis TaxID=2802975 RepID=A0ABM8HYW5_9BACT|nr:hypothetical protein [Desulfuromonas versatilis]BCR05905.1 hypothetical protein DESUT3_29740 [Desulfuromonas versatilis]
MDRQKEFIEELSAQMVEWDVAIELLQEQAETGTPEKRYEYARAIAELQLKRDEAAEKLQGLAAAGEDEWEELKAGAEMIWDEVKAALRETLKKQK